MLKFMGCEGQIASPDSTLKKQNTSELRDKVSNLDVLQNAVAEAALSTLDAPRLVDAPRGPAVRSYVAAPASKLIYLPVPGGPNAEVEDWMAKLERRANGSLVRAMTQKQLRDLRSRDSALRSFTVLRHPVFRRSAAFYEKKGQKYPGS